VSLEWQELENGGRLCEQVNRSREKASMCGEHLQKEAPTMMDIPAPRTLGSEAVHRKNQAKGAKQKPRTDKGGGGGGGGGGPAPQAEQVGRTPWDTCIYHQE